LANDGIIFDNLWVSPTCSPTRAALISGKYGHQTNVLSPGDTLPVGDTILQSFMKDNTATSDYESAMIGKWHLGGGRTGPNDYGLDHFAGILGGGVSDYYN
jgi:arylsulfatase A-like enzyme